MPAPAPPGRASGGGGWGGGPLAQPAQLAQPLRVPLPLGRWRAPQPELQPELQRALHGELAALRHRAAALVCWTA